MAAAAAAAADRAATLQAMGVALLPGDKIDPTRPRLVNLNQDPLFSECLVYYVNDGVTLIGSDAGGDIQLSGTDMCARHAVLTYSSPDLIHLCPLDGAATYLNGQLISAAGNNSNNNNNNSNTNSRNNNSNNQQQQQQQQQQPQQQQEQHQQRPHPQQP